MAYGGGAKPARPVLLGFVDEFMETDREHFTTNKIGGKPVSSVCVRAIFLGGNCGFILHHTHENVVRLGHSQSPWPWPCF